MGRADRDDHRRLPLAHADDLRDRTGRRSAVRAVLPGRGRARQAGRVPADDHGHPATLLATGRPGRHQLRPVVERATDIGGRPPRRAGAEPSGRLQVQARTLGGAAGRRRPGVSGPPDRLDGAAPHDDGHPPHDRGKFARRSASLLRVFARSSQRSRFALHPDAPRAGSGPGRLRRLRRVLPPPRPLQRTAVRLRHQVAADHEADAR